MDRYICYDLYGKPSEGTKVRLDLRKKIQSEMVFFMRMSPTPLIIDDYFRMDEDYYMRFSTRELYGYFEAIESVARFSEQYPGFVFKLEIFNSALDVTHERYHIQNGKIEQMNGHIEYEEPKKIQY